MPIDPRRLRSRTAWRTAATALIVAALALPVAAHAQDAGPAPLSLDEYQALHPMVTERDMIALGERIARATAEVRVTTDLGPVFNPRYLTGTGAAIWITTPETGPILVSSWAWLAGNVRVEIRRGAEWQEVQPLHQTAFWDLTVLDAEVGDFVPLELAPPNRGDGSVYSALPAAADGQTGTAAAGVLGAHARGPGSYYRMTSFPFRNGFGLTNILGEVVAVLSIADPEGSGTSFAIDADAVREWIAAWPRIVDASPTGVAPVEATDVLFTRPEGRRP